MTLLTTHDLFTIINETLLCGGIGYETSLNSLCTSATFRLNVIKRSALTTIVCFLPKTTHLIQLYSQIHIIQYLDYLCSMTEVQ